MNPTHIDNTLNRTAKTASAALHPIIAPLYGLLLIFVLPTLHAYISTPVKKLLITTIILNNITVPLFMLYLLKAKQQITTWEIENRRERMLPLFFITLLYALTAYIVIKYPTPIFIKTYFIAIFFISATITIINNWYKISIHAAGMGALTALSLTLTFRMYEITLWPLAAIIILSGITLFSRLKLNSHTPPQVWLGYFAGLAELCATYHLL